MGLQQCAPNQHYSRRNYYTLEKPWLSVNTPGPSIGYKINLSTATREITMITTTSKLATTTQVEQQTKTPLQAMFYRTISGIQKIPLETWLDRPITITLLIQKRLQ